MNFGYLSRNEAEDDYFDLPVVDTPKPFKVLMDAPKPLTDKAVTSQPTMEIIERPTAMVVLVVVAFVLLLFVMVSIIAWYRSWKRRRCYRKKLSQFEPVLSQNVCSLTKSVTQPVELFDFGRPVVPNESEMSGAQSEMDSASNEVTTVYSSALSDPSISNSCYRSNVDRVDPNESAGVHSQSRIRVVDDCVYFIGCFKCIVSRETVFFSSMK